MSGGQKLSLFWFWPCHKSRKILIPPSRNWPCTLGGESTESQPLDCQGSPRESLLLIELTGVHAFFFVLSSICFIVFKVPSWITEVLLWLWFTNRVKTVCFSTIRVSLYLVEYAIWELFLLSYTTLPVVQLGDQIYLPYLSRSHRAKCVSFYITDEIECKYGVCINVPVTKNVPLFLQNPNVSIFQSNLVVLILENGWKIF